MRHAISPDRRKLTIIIDDEDRETLRELGDDIHADSSMVDFLEPLTCNSDLQWIDAEWNGDLTSAPMLGIIAHWDDAYPVVAERWAWMDYQVCSLLESLLRDGKATLTT